MHTHPPTTHAHYPGVGAGVYHSGSQTAGRRLVVVLKPSALNRDLRALKVTRARRLIRPRHDTHGAVRSPRLLVREPFHLAKGCA